MVFGQVRLGNCRFDFVVSHKDGSRTIIEVKNVRHRIGLYAR